MAEIVWKLDEVLDELDISPNKLSVESKVRPNTIYNMVYKKAVRFNFDTVTKILIALNQIAEEEGLQRKFNVQDVLEYIE